MEKNAIGTDASIPVHINNICERNYVQVKYTCSFGFTEQFVTIYTGIYIAINLQVQAGRKLVPTALGVTLIRGYQCIDPDLCLPDIRGFIEQQITLIAKGQSDHSQVMKHALHQFMNKYNYFVKQVKVL